MSVLLEDEREVDERTEEQDLDDLNLVEFPNVLDEVQHEVVPNVEERGWA